MNSRLLLLAQAAARLFATLFLLGTNAQSSQAVAAPFCRRIFDSSQAGNQGVQFEPRRLKVSGHFEFKSFSFDGSLTSLYQLLTILLEERVLL